MYCIIERTSSLILNNIISIRNQCHRARAVLQAAQQSRALRVRDRVSLWLLVQLHVRHQNVLLRLLGGAGAGAAVAGPVVGAPGAEDAPPVQVDDPHDQQHQDQARRHDDDQGGQVVHFGCSGLRRKVRVVN